MSFTRTASKTVTLSTLGAATTTLSTSVDGYVRAVYVQGSSAHGAGSKVTLTAATSTDRIILKVVPTSGGVWYYPHALAQGTTGGTMPSSYPALIPLSDEFVRVNVASSSGNSNSIYVKLWVE